MEKAKQIVCIALLFIGFSSRIYAEEIILTPLPEGFILPQLDEIRISGTNLIWLVDRVMERGKNGVAIGASRRAAYSLDNPDDAALYEENVDRWLGMGGVTNWPGLLVLNEYVGDDRNVVTNYFNHERKLLDTISSYIGLVNRLPRVKEEMLVVDPPKETSVTARIRSLQVTTNGIDMVYELQNNTETGLWMIHPQQAWDLFQLSRVDQVLIPSAHSPNFYLNPCTWLLLYPGDTVIRSTTIPIKIFPGPVYYEAWGNTPGKIMEDPLLAKYCKDNQVLYAGLFAIGSIHDDVIELTINMSANADELLADSRKYLPPIPEVTGQEVFKPFGGISSSSTNIYVNAAMFR